MNKLPYYITEPNSFMSYVKGTIEYWFPTFISYWWWFAIVVFLTMLLSVAIHSALRDINDTESPFKHLIEKSFWKDVILPLFFVYMFFITFLFAPFRYHCSTHDKWDKFVDECIEKKQFEYLDSVSAIHYGEVKID